jgi:uncharacterized protein DUF6930
MPRGRTNSNGGSSPSQFFANELAGEIPPSFSIMERLYGLASHLYMLRPWHLLDESELVLIRDSATGEVCYCSVMGRLGEVLAMHAYIGSESYRLFRRVAAGELTDVGEFFEGQHSVYVEFVPTAGLDGQDKTLLAAFGHPLRKEKVAPVFRTIRPGHHPWYVTEEEARTLYECIRAVIVICSAASVQAGLNYWDRENTYPLVSRVEGDETNPRYRVELEEVVLSAEAPLSPVQLKREHLRQLRNRDHAIRGVIELDYFLSGAVVGKKNERKACVRIALAVDADTGIVFPPALAPPGVSVGEALAMAIIKMVETSRALPTEVRVQSKRFKDYLGLISEACGIAITVVPSLPTLADARANLLGMMGGRGFPGSST